MDHQAEGLPRAQKGPMERGGQQIVLHETLTPRGWPCAMCGSLIRRREPIRVTITPGGGANRVEHDFECPRSDRESPAVPSIGNQQPAASSR